MRLIAFVLTLGLVGPAAAQVTNGGAGNTGVELPGTGARATSPSIGTASGTAATPSNSPVPGTTPGVAIGGTPTAGPPGSGGTAGGAALGNR